MSPQRGDLSGTGGTEASAMSPANGANGPAGGEASPERRDGSGVPIAKGKGGMHKVIFADEVQQGAPIAEVREVKPVKNAQNSCCVVS
mmetsp:Transcript_785/g.1930  ORF Transcript_785/g.1930 Transcript_785/m.1930 type:complete len:88 (-) Transcript_785:187-450(-)